MILRFIALVVLLLYLPAAAANISITVLPFSQKGSQSHSWIGTAIADLLMQNLVELSSVHVLDRDMLQSYLKELEFQQSGFVSNKTTQRLGRIARVDQVIHGYYKVSEQNQIEVTLQVTQTDSQSVVRLESIAGDIAKINELIELLTLNYLHNHHQPPDENELARIQQSKSISLPAMEHFYRGLGEYDAGAPAKAFGEFYQASRADPGYLKARLWMGQSLVALNQVAMAIELYRELYREAPNRVESLDGLLKAAELLLENEPLVSMPLYQALVDEYPGTAHSLFAAMRLGELYSEQEEWLRAYNAYALVDRVRAQVEQSLPGQLRERHQPNLKPQRTAYSNIKNSQYASWERALPLYRNAIQKMALLYARMANEQTPATNQAGELPPLPRGVIHIEDIEQAVSRSHRTPAPSMFHERLINTNWREDFYVVIMPAGYEAIAAKVGIQGKLNQSHTTHDFTIKLHEFPLTADTSNLWLGTLYGQTSRVSRLGKRIPFFGKRLGLFAVQIVENHGKVFEWSVKPDLVKASAPQELITTNTTAAISATEGVRLAKIPITRQQTGQPQLLPKEDRRYLAVTSTRADELVLVAALKNPDTQRVNLHASYSQDAISWTPFKSMPVNSQGDDLAPTLVTGEDGSVHLFWLSNRRGEGWDLWHTVRPHVSKLWTPARRISLNKVVKSAPPQVNDEAQQKPVESGMLERWKNKLLDIYRQKTETTPKPVPSQQVAVYTSIPDLLPGSSIFPYSVIQDKRGRWIIALSQKGRPQIDLLVSSDGEQWDALGYLPINSRVDNLAVGLDTTARYHLALFSRGKLNHWTSNDAYRWRKDRLNPYNGFGTQSTSLYRANLRPEPDGSMIVLFADTQTGVQYSRFRPGQPIADADLVKDANLFPYSLTRYQDEYWLMALARRDGIEILRYQNFASTGNPKNNNRQVIYRESENDAQGNRWDRIFARWRMILPDVTAVGVSDNGRLWWGIETGIMSMHGDKFTMKDVTDGFFNHHVTDILPCGKRTVLAARDYPNLNLGIAVSSGRDEPRFSQTQLAASNEAVTTMACFKDNAIIATSAGRLHRLGDDNWQVSLSGSSITALAVSERTGQLVAGTSDGEIYLIDNPGKVKSLPEMTTATVTALSVDLKGKIWAAVEGQGLAIWDTDSNRWYKPKKQPYRYIDKMVADNKQGVWLMPGDREHSRGLVLHDGIDAQWFNPPSRTLEAPIDLAMAKDGSLWIGTAFDGLYQLTVKSL